MASTTTSSARTSTSERWRPGIRLATALAAASLAAACSSTDTVASIRVDSAADADGAKEASIDVAPDLEPPLPFGSWAAQLPVRACPVTGNQLVVTTTADELDGGTTIADPAQAGPQLSLAEALWIAENRAGPDTIRFAAAAFPVDQPGTIPVGVGRALPGIPTEPLCIDGRDRGVIVAWQPEATALTLGPGSLMVGLTLRCSSNALQLNDGQIAGCRIEGLTTQVDWAVELLAAAQLGPGNIISGDRGVRVQSGTPLIVGNYLGYDPRTEENVGLDIAFDLCCDARVTVSENVIAAAEFANVSNNGWEIDVVGNHFGVDRSGDPLPKPAAGVVFSPGTSGTGRLTLGPNNVVRHVETAVEVRLAGTRITRNSIAFNGAGIVFGGVTPPPAPTIDAASATAANGSCAAAGTVELFSDAGHQGEIFVASVPCTPPSWSHDGAIPTGRNLTATFTTAAGETSGFSAPRAVP